MKNSKTLALGIALAILIIGTVSAKEGKKQGNHGPKFQGSEELQELRQQQRKLRQEYREKRKAENEGFHKSLKDKSPEEALTAIISHQKSQYADTKSFMDGLHNSLVAKAKEIMAKNEVPADKQAEILKKIADHRAKAIEKHKEMHEKLIAALEGLKGTEGLTLKQIKSTVKSILPNRKEKKNKVAKK